MHNSWSCVGTIRCITLKHFDDNSLLYNCDFVHQTFAVRVSLQAPACQWPICKRSILLTQSFCPRSFSVRRSAVIFSFERQSHWDSVCCFTRQWEPFKSNGLLSVCVSNSALSWVSAELSSSTLHLYSQPLKHTVYDCKYKKSLILIFNEFGLMYCFNGV